MKLLIRDIKYWLQRRTRGWSDDETWNLDLELMKWLNSRFKKFKELARIKDLEYFTYQYKNKVYTQQQIIDRVIDITNNYISDETNLIGFYNQDEMNELFDLVRLVFYDMWW